MNAIVLEKTGGPEVLTPRETPVPAPKEGEALVRLEAIGVNFIDVYHRTGLYPMTLPGIPGMEGAGRVAAVGVGVSAVTIGDHVVWALHPGAYAGMAAVPAWKLAKIPAGVDGRTAAAVMLQGMTAHYLTHSTRPLLPGDTALVHAAAGGVGLLLVQMVRRLGARVLATAGSEEKARLAREAGADETIVYTQRDFAAEVKRLTGGRGVQVVYDGVGRDTFQKDFDCLARRGMLVSFGQSSGPVLPFDPLVLSQRGSLYLTRPTLADYAATPDEIRKRAGDVLEWVRKGDLRVRIDGVMKLARASDAHRRLESRASSGKILLEP